MLVEATPIMNGSSPGYIKYIDGLRAVAVLGVFINHLGEGLLSSGFLGVDIFFVISGFVITGSLVKSRDLKLATFLKNFYRRRILRILPALLVYLLIIGVATIFIIPNSAFYLQTASSAVFGFSNILLAKEAVNYFGSDAAFNPFTQTWSLGVEEQFYFIVPLIVWYCFRFASRNASISNGAILPSSLTTVVRRLSLVSVFIYIIGSLLRPHLAYFLMPSRFWEMGLGILAYDMRCRSLEHGLKPAPSRKISSVVLFGLIVGSLFVFKDFRIISTILVCVCTALLISVTSDASPVSRLLSWEPLRYIGKLSYSIYLWHWGLIALSKWSIGEGYSSYFFIIVATLLISVFSYHFIEQPFRRISDFSNRVIFGAAIPTLIVSSLTIVNLKSIVSNFPLSIASDRAKGESRLVGQGRVHEQLMRCQAPKNIQKMAFDCLGYNLHLSPSRRAVYIIGDSHASQLYPSVVSALKRLGRDDNVFYLSENGFVMGVTQSGILNRVFNRDSCFGFTADSCLYGSFSVINRLFAERLRPGDIVIFTLASYRVSKDKDARLPRPYSPSAVSNLERKLKILGGTIQEAGSKLALIDDVIATCKYPGLNYGYLVLQKEMTSACEMGYSLGTKDRIGFTTALQNAASSLRSTHYYDFAKDLCDGEICSVIDPRNGRLLYADARNHFTASYPDPLANQMIEVLNQGERQAD